MISSYKSSVVKVELGSPEKKCILMKGKSKLRGTELYRKVYVYSPHRTVMRDAKSQHKKNSGRVTYPKAMNIDELLMDAFRKTEAIINLSSKVK